MFDVSDDCKLPIVTLPSYIVNYYCQLTRTVHPIFNLKTKLFLGVLESN